MCSILGVLGKTVSPEILQACFARTASRGPDMGRFVELPCGYLGFQRLSIKMCIRDSFSTMAA